MNLGNFDKQARAAEREVVREATETIRAVSIEAFSDIRERAADVGGAHGSPVASGRYAASVNISINTIDDSTAPEDRKYEYPPATVHKYNADNLPARTRRNSAASRASNLLRGFKLGDRIFISNSVPYAERIEREGWSWQTPSGVFETTVRQVVKKFSGVRLRVFRG